jgi:heme-degrading monooxygenase HmoA
MIARIWRGVVPLEKAQAYAAYLSDFGVRDYQAYPGNRGVQLLQRTDGGRVHFLLLSLWESRESIEAYAGPDIDRAHYYAYDRECLIDPAPCVEHFEVLVGTVAATG